MSFYLPDNYYDPPECQAAPRGTYAHAVQLLKSHLADLISDAKLEGENLTTANARKGLSDHADSLVGDGDEDYPIERLDEGEWDDAVDEALQSSPLFAECGYRTGPKCETAAERCAEMAQ